MTSIANDLRRDTDGKLTSLVIIAQFFISSLFFFRPLPDEESGNVV